MTTTILKPWEMNQTEYDKAYPKLEELSESQQRKILDSMNKYNKQETGVDEPIPFEMFKKDFADVRFVPNSGEVVMREHKEVVKEALSASQKLPEHIKTEYADIVAEHEAKRVKREIARGKKQAARIKVKVEEAKPKEESKTIEEPKPHRTMADLRKIEESRTNRSQMMDERKINAKVISPTNPKVEKWAAHPGRLDVQGIDAPRRTPVTIKARQLPFKLKPPKPPKNTLKNKRVGRYFTANGMVSRHPIGRRRK